MWLILLGIAFVIFLCRRTLEAHKYWTKKGVPQVNSWPIFGTIGPAIVQKRSLTDVIQDAYNAFTEKRYCGIYQFQTPALLIRCPNLIKMITVKDFDVFPEHRKSLPPESDPLFTNNIFTMRGGQRWHDLRATLSPSFTSSKLKGMFGLMQQCAEQCIQHFQKQNLPIIIEIKDLFSRYTSDVIGTTAFGVTCDSFKNPENEFYRIGKDATDLTAMKAIKLFLNTLSSTLVKVLKPRILSSHVDTFFRTLISDSIDLRERQKLVRPDMLHLLMEARKAKPEVELTKEDITAQAFIFFLAGFDTSSSAMSFTAYELAINPDIQKRLQEEIDNVSELSYDSLLEMKYMDMVISESLRKWPPVTFTDRKSIKPYTIEPELPREERIYLEKGEEIWIPIFALHRDPQYYPDPERFDPERFRDAQKHNINNLVYLPFGSGPRNCIGSRFALLEIKLIIFYILRNFDIVPTRKTQVPLILSPKQLFPMPKGGFWLELKPRANTLTSKM